MNIKWKATASLTSGTGYTVATDLPAKARPMFVFVTTFYNDTRPYVISCDSAGLVTLVPKASGITSGQTGSVSFTYLVN